jgi:hypothetical protein
LCIFKRTLSILYLILILYYKIKSIRIQTDIMPREQFNYEYVFLFKYFTSILKQQELFINEIQSRTEKSGTNLIKNLAEIELSKPELV